MKRVHLCAECVAEFSIFLSPLRKDFISSFLNTFSADTTHFNVSCFNFTKRNHRIRESDVIKIIAVEVTSEPTLPTNKMMVTVQVGVETGPFTA